MTKKKKATSRKRTAKKTSTPSASTTGARIRVAWADAVKALGSAQANLEGELKKVLERNRIGTKDAATLLKDVRALAERQRKRAARELKARAAQIQTRVKKEGKVASRAVDEAVRSALAALNIPSRAEVANLTRKVEELTKKVAARRR
ncbi:MAG TPA: phasin family protein [Vicinamibacteria bacterium]|nr:phasin family protein [Vicinamibacteria bacterium]